MSIITKFKVNFTLYKKLSFTDKKFNTCSFWNTVDQYELHMHAACERFRHPILAASATERKQRAKRTIQKKNVPSMSYGNFVFMVLSTLSSDRPREGWFWAINHPLLCHWVTESQWKKVKVKKKKNTFLTAQTHINIKMQKDLIESEQIGLDCKNRF